MLVSVITPVYNTAQYLDECIGSILSQSMTDFELLLIDDGSTDGSGAICDRYAEKDKRIRVFHIPNGGVSAARNLGLDNARGEFVVFVDSDDRITPDHLRQLADAISLPLCLRSVVPVSGMLYNAYRFVHCAKVVIYSRLPSAAALQ